MPRDYKAETYPLFKAQLKCHSTQNMESTIALRQDLPSIFQPPALLTVAAPASPLEGWTYFLSFGFILLEGPKNNFGET